MYRISDHIVSLKRDKNVVFCKQSDPSLPGCIFPKFIIFILPYLDSSRVQTQAVLPRVRSEERSEEACSEERSEEGLSSARLNGVVLSSSDLNSTNLLLAFSRSNVLTRPTGQRKMPVWTRQRSVLRVSMTLRPYEVYGVSLQPNRYIKLVWSC